MIQRCTVDIEGHAIREAREEVMSEGVIRDEIRGTRDEGRETRDE